MNEKGIVINPQTGRKLTDVSGADPLSRRVFLGTAGAAALGAGPAAAGLMGPSYFPAQKSELHFLMEPGSIRGRRFAVRIGGL